MQTKKREPFGRISCGEASLAVMHWNLWTTTIHIN